MPATSKKRSSSSRSSNRSNSRQRSSGRSGSDALSLLKEDHQRVRQLLKRLESNGSEELLNQVETEIKVHSQIEEEIFYPAFKEAVESQQDEHLYYEALEEHHVVDLVMPEIKETNEGTEEFDAKAKVLKELVEHHAQEEERQMFPKARKAMGAARLRELGEQLAERKQELMGEGGGRLERLLKPMMSGRRGGGKKSASGNSRRRSAA